MLNLDLKKLTRVRIQAETDKLKQSRINQTRNEKNPLSMRPYSNHLVDKLRLPDLMQNLHQN